MKKIIPYLLAGYLIIQLVVPGLLVYQHYNTLRIGEDYKFVVEPYDPYDPFRGRYVAIDTEVELYPYDGEYALLHKDEAGFVQVVERATSKPSDSQYAKNLQLDRYYMSEELAPEAERLQRELDLTTQTMYLLVKVNNGHYVIEGLYVDDVPIEQYIATHSV